MDYENGDAFRTLLERYADGRSLCNCGLAYYTNCGHAWIGNRKVTDRPTCKHGCSANQIMAKYYVASRALADLTASPPTPGSVG